MEVNKKTTAYHSKLVWIVLFIVLIISFINNWSAVSIVISVLIGSIVIIFFVLLNNHLFLKDFTNKIEPVQSGAESLIVQGKAKRLMPNSTVEGVLYLTNLNIIFATAENKSLELNLHDIKAISLYRVFGFLKRGIIIKAVSGIEEKFILKYPDDWKNIIAVSLDED